MNIIFDLDGTLTDSGPGIIRCARETFAKYAIPSPDDATMRTIVGPPLRSSFRKFGIPEKLVDEAVAYYRSIYAEGGIFENAPYPGIHALLQRLKSAGHKLYVATSKPEHMAIAVLKHFDMDDCFDRICGALTDGVRDKKSAILQYLLESVDRPDNSVMVGDTIFDIEGAAQVGLPAIAVSWGYGNMEDMLAAGAVGNASTMDELYQLLTK